MTIQEILAELQQHFHTTIEAANDSASLNLVRSRLIGKQGEISHAFAQLRNAPVEQRKQLGAEINSLKMSIERALAQREDELIAQADNLLSFVDLSLPVTTSATVGHGHPTQLVLEDVYEIFLRLGFAIVDSNEVESDWYNFEVLNMPQSHPARDMQDTFYLESDGSQPPLLPRTHTSAAQIRFMEQYKPPFKIIVPGKVYRNEDEDRTHSWSFYQVEGLVVGEGVSMADLKGTLLHAMQGLLGDEIKIRFRPSFFPYTEPSVEVDVWYQDEWLEVLGAGMVHPKVLAAGGVDPTKYSGFAFGFGSDRLTMPRYQLTDLRRLWRPNLLASDQL